MLPKNTTSVKLKEKAARFQGLLLRCQIEGMKISLRREICHLMNWNLTLHMLPNGSLVVSVYDTVV